MEYPTEVQALIDGLEAAAVRRNVDSAGSDDEAYAVIEYGDQRLELRGRACSLLLETARSVKLLYEAIGSPENSSVTVVDLELDDDVVGALEHWFDVVEEGA